MLKASLGADGKFPPAVMKIFDTKQLPAGDLLIAKGAQVGKFAGMIKSQFDKEGSSAFDLSLPFDEVQLLSSLSCLSSCLSHTSIHTRTATPVGGASGLPEVQGVWHCHPELHQGRH